MNLIFSKKRGILSHFRQKQLRITVRILTLINYRYLYFAWIILYFVSYSNPPPPRNQFCPRFVDFKSLFTVLFISLWVMSIARELTNMKISQFSRQSKSWVTLPKAFSDGTDATHLARSLAVYILIVNLVFSSFYDSMINCPTNSFNVSTRSVWSVTTSNTLLAQWILNVSVDEISIGCNPI